MQTQSNLFIKEDLNYLENWLTQAKSMAKQINSQAQKEGILSIFTISTTIKSPKSFNPYLTPIRRIIHGFIGGSVVFSQTQALLLAKYIDGTVDQILVDAEKKIKITLELDEEAIRHFKLAPPPRDNIKSRVPLEMGNLSAACADIINKSTFHEYKPNDITVEAVWHYLSYSFNILSGKKIAIIGGGNIGFKLALKLVESGCSVELVRRDIERGRLMANVIDIAKPKATIATAHYNADPLQAALFSDVIIGCTDGKPAITLEMIKCMRPEGLVIDVGKGSVHKDAVSYAIKFNIPIMRCDISSAIDGLISTIQRNKQIIEKEMGRKEIVKGIFVVSGGRLGKQGDIVVDDYQNPTQIYGLADGSGDMKQKLSKTEIKIIADVKKLFYIK